MAVSAVIATLMLLIAGSELAYPPYSITPGTPPNFIEFDQLIMYLLGYGIFGLSPVTPFILAFIYTTLAGGLLFRQRWAWVLSIIVYLLSIGLNILQSVALWNSGGRPAGTI